MLKMLSVKQGIVITYFSSILFQLDEGMEPTSTGSKADVLITITINARYYYPSIKEYVLFHDSIVCQMIIFQDLIEFFY